MARRRKNSSAISWWHDIKADYTRFKKWNAKRRVANVKLAKERRTATEASAKAKLESDALKAERKARRETNKAARDAQVRARRAAAEQRAQSTAAKPQVIKARVSSSPARGGANPMTKYMDSENDWKYPEGAARHGEKTIDPQCKCGLPHSNPAHVTDHLFVMADDTPRRPAMMRPAARPAVAAQKSALCGARTEDGSPCQHPTTGGPCSAGHQPKGHRQTRKQGAARQGIPVRVVSTGDYWNTDQTVIYADGKPQAIFATEPEPRRVHRFGKRRA